MTEDKELWSGALSNKLLCNNCGLIIESGLMNVMRHVYDECKAITTEKIDDRFSVKKMPYMNFSPVEDTGEQSPLNRSI